MCKDSRSGDGRFVREPESARDGGAHMCHRDLRLAVENPALVLILFREHARDDARPQIEERALGARIIHSAGLVRGTHLIGAIPEFDSMAVVSVITALEERFGIAVEDDEITAEVFQTVGSLTQFVEGKLGPDGPRS